MRPFLRKHEKEIMKFIEQVQVQAAKAQGAAAEAGREAMAAASDPSNIAKAASMANEV